MGLLSRRALFRRVGGGVGAAVAGGAVALASAPPAGASEVRKAPAGAVGMLYDATKCIGCKACVAECAKVNDLTPDTAPSPTIVQPLPGPPGPLSPTASARSRGAARTSTLGNR